MERQPENPTAFDDPPEFQDGWMIINLWWLVRHLGGEEGTDPVIAERWIGEQLFRNARGISFRAQPRGITVAAYVEGVDFDLDGQGLDYPFTREAFDKAVKEEADRIKAAWDQTHGCDDCPESETYPGYKRIDPKCPACKGEGLIL